VGPLSAARLDSLAQAPRGQHQPLADLTSVSSNATETPITGKACPASEVLGKEVDSPDCAGLPARATPAEGPRLPRRGR
jgi:hypothetical protein